MVNYYELSHHELERISEKRREAAQCYAIAAFTLGLAVDTTKDFAFSPPGDPFQTGLWSAILAASICAALYFGWKGWRNTTGANDVLKDIKDQHDFESDALLKAMTEGEAPSAGKKPSTPPASNERGPDDCDETQTRPDTSEDASR